MDDRHAARVIELPRRYVAALRYGGDTPPAPGLAAHWRRFRAWLDETPIDRAEREVLAIAYTPPGPLRGPVIVELCVPLAEGAALPSGDNVARTLWLPGGRFVIATGAPEELASLYRAARDYAMSHGLAIDRGGIEIYRQRENDAVVVDAGYRIHD